MSGKKEINYSYDDEQIQFTGPQKVTGEVKSELIKLDPQPSFSSGADGENSTIYIPESYYKAKKSEVDQIMNKFNYSQS